MCLDFRHNEIHKLANYSKIQNHSKCDSTFSLSNLSPWQKESHNTVFIENKKKMLSRKRDYEDYPRLGLVQEMEIR